MCNMIRRFLGLNNFARFNHEIDLRESRGNSEMGRISVHRILPAPAETPVTGQVSEFKYLVKDKPTLLLQKILASRKNKERELLESHGLSEEEYRVYYDVQENTVDKIALTKADFNKKVQVTAKIYADTLTELKRFEEVDKANKDRTLEGFIHSCLETMVDDEDEREILASRLEDTNISSGSFLSFSDLTDETRFQAHYQDARITLSNRTGGVELRSDRLKGVMTSYQYSTLKDLLSKLYLTEDDHQMAYLVSGIMKMNISAICQEHDLSKEQTNNIKRKFETVKFRGVPLINLIPHYFLYD